MKHFVIHIFILFFHFSARGQSDSIYVKYSLLYSLDDKSIAIYVGKFNYHYPDSARWIESESFSEIIMTFNNNHDTCIIESSDYITKMLDTLYLKPIQIAHNKEGVILTLKITERSNLGEHGDYEITRTVNEIWDIKSRKKIFSAISKYQYSADYMSWDDSTSYYSTTNYFFEYDFALSDRNEIIIKNLKTKLDVSEDRSTTNESKFPSYCECKPPDHEEGIYSYKKGQFKLNK